MPTKVQHNIVLVQVTLVVGCGQSARGLDITTSGSRSRPWVFLLCENNICGSISCLLFSFTSTSVHHVRSETKNTKLMRLLPVTRDAERRRQSAGSISEISRNMAEREHQRKQKRLLPTFKVKHATNTSQTRSSEEKREEH
jgi:hypothetical protein